MTAFSLRSVEFQIVTGLKGARSDAITLTSEEFGPYVPFLMPHVLCFVSCAVIRLCQMGYLTVKAGKENPFASNQLKLCADSWGDIMEALPILSLAFMAHFNILSVSASFVRGDVMLSLDGKPTQTLRLTSLFYSKTVRQVPKVE